jgi:hypothetical protein
VRFVGEVGRKPHLFPKTGIKLIAKRLYRYTTRKVQKMQQVFQDGEKYYLVEVTADNRIILKVKENGWGDTWSLPVEERTWGND